MTNLENKSGEVRAFEFYKLGRTQSVGSKLRKDWAKQLRAHGLLPADPPARHPANKDSFTQVYYRYAAVMAYLAKRSNGRVLEVGCGYGLPARILKDVCEEIVGIDPDLNAVAVARELFPEIPIKPLTLEEYFAEYPEERFDVIVSAFTPLEATIPKILQRCNVYIRVGYRPKNFSEVISVRDRWSSRSLRFDTRAWGEVVAGFDLTYFRWLVHIDFPRWLRRTYRKWGFPSF